VGTNTLEIPSDTVTGLGFDTSEMPTKRYGVTINSRHLRTSDTIKMSS
jgi:hypothetical protein